MESLFFATFVISVYQSLAFHSPFMCNNDRVTDCSFQISSNSNSCLIYNTEVCDESFADLFPYLPSLYEFETEKDAPLEVSLLPYVLQHLSNPISALNITIKVKQNGIHAFSLVLSHEEAAINICRVFDFRTVSATLQYPIIFFYDCFNRLAEKLKGPPVFSFTAYPLNFRLSYIVFIPPVFEQLDSVCFWKPLVMVLCGGLKNSVVELKFAQAPEVLNVLFYILTLRDPSDSVIERVEVLSSGGGEMLSKSFSAVSSGFYSLETSFSTKDNASCPSSHTDLFYVGRGNASTSGVMLLALCISSSALTLISCVFSYMLYFHKKYCSTEKKILLIHCIDTSAHHDLMLCLKHFLERELKCVVHDIYKTGCDAYTFILGRFSEADAFVFVASEGAYEVIERGESTPSQDNHPCQNQLQKAYKIYFSKFHELGDPHTKTCVISFHPSGQQYVPRMLKPIKVFDLPQNEREFVFFLFGCLWCQTRLKSLRHDGNFNECLERVKQWRVENACNPPAKNTLPEEDYLEDVYPSAALNPEEVRLTEPGIDLTFADQVDADLKFNVRDPYMENILFN